MITSHAWVKHTITPIVVLSDDKGEPVILVDPDDQALSETDAVYGCMVCGEAMATHYNTDCKGEV